MQRGGWGLPKQKKNVNVALLLTPLNKSYEAGWGLLHPVVLSSQIRAND